MGTKRGGEANPARATGGDPTMQDVADAAGVSQSTVSRILAGANIAIPISPATRQRVIDTARRMHYRPNPLARGLVGSKTMLLGVIVREITDPFFAVAVEAISDEAAKLGYNVVLGHAHGNATQAIALRAVLETRHCDALILVGDTSDQPLLLRDLEETSVTVVGVWQGESTMPGVTAVNVDNRQGIFDLVDHLTDLGHRRIAFIGGRFRAGLPLGDIRQRLLAYQDRLSEKGIPARPEYMVESLNNLAGGAEAMETLMRLPEPPTAVVASTDQLALGALSKSSQMNLPVPGRVSIGGFDDLPASQFAIPPLTTVRQPIVEMSTAAVRAAIDGQAWGGATVAVLRPILTVRQSTGPAPKD
jgi:DNA-binding LacI/PurR family transcriptional regulator